VPAEAAYRKAIALKPDLAEAHHGLGNALREQRKLAPAEAAYRKAIALKPDYAQAHSNFGIVLWQEGKLAEAVTANRKAIALKPDYAEAYSNLGVALRDQGKLAEAVAAFRKATELKPAVAGAHANLGHALLEQGRFTDALAAYKGLHELGARNAGWPYPSAQWVRRAEYLVALDAKLPRFLSGQAQPAGAGEGIALAQLCQIYKERYAAAAGFYAAAFTAQPKLADDLSGHRYNAACAAALAGGGQGKDATGLGAMQRLYWRRQALTWLRAELDAWGKRLKKEPDKMRPVLIMQMQHWRQDTDLAGVRDKGRLARLPAEERAAWARLWADVAATRDRAAGKPAPAKKAERK
jgi:tetratricopeptide (TPR) repeat protein